MNNINNKSTPPLKLSDIAMKVLFVYKEWNNAVPKIPKMRRYSLGIKIDTLLSEVIELISTAQFSKKEDRLPIIGHAIAKNDVLKVMLYLLLDLKGIEEDVFILLAPKLEEVGRMLYGWRNRIMTDQTKPPRS